MHRYPQTPFLKLKSDFLIPEDQSMFQALAHGTACHAGAYCRHFTIFSHGRVYAILICFLPMIPTSIV